VERRRLSVSEQAGQPTVIATSDGLKRRKLNRPARRIRRNQEPVDTKSKSSKADKKDDWIDHCKFKYGQK